PRHLQVTLIPRSHPERIPHRRRRIHNVVGARRLVIVHVITALRGIALVHHLRHHAPPVPRDLYLPKAALPVVEPSARQRHDPLLVAVELVVALRRPAAVFPLLEAVDGEDGFGLIGDRRGALVGGVQLALNAAVGVVDLVALVCWRLFATELAAGGAGLGFGFHVQVEEDGEGESESGEEDENRTTHIVM
ncbi:unnamed protein product, partial [Linum tenue]